MLCEDVELDRVDGAGRASCPVAMVCAGASRRASGSGEAIPDVEAPDPEPLAKAASKIEGAEKEGAPRLAICESLPLKPVVCVSLAVPSLAVVGGDEGPGFAGGLVELANAASEGASGALTGEG